MTDGQQNHLDSFIRSAQYLAGLTTLQDVWTETGELLANFWGADLAGFGRRGSDGEIIISHWTCAAELVGLRDFTVEAREDIAAVLSSGFLTWRSVSSSSEPSVVAFFPIAQENQVSRVLLVGHRRPDSIPKDLLNNYLALAGLVGTTAARLNSEVEVREHRRRLETLVRERTAQLTGANQQLQQEVLQRRQVNEFLNNVLEALTHPFFVINPENHAIELANSAAAMFGSLTGSTCYSITYGRDKPCDGLGHQCPLQEIKNTKHPMTIEHVHSGMDGLSKYFEIHAYPVLDDNENLRQVIEYWVDITDRKKAEQLAQERNKFQQTLIDAVPIPIFFKDSEGKYLGCNDAFSKYLGQTKAEILGKSVFDLSPKHLAEIYHAKDTELFNTGGVQIYESRVRYADGTEHDVIFYKSVFPGPGGILGGLIGCIVDITERKQAEQALKESELKYRHLFNNSEVGMFRTKLDGSEVLETNEQFLKIFGCTREEMQGKPSLKHWADPREREEMLRKLEADGRVTDFECQMLDKQGNLRTCVVSLKLYPEKQVLEGSMIDITERKRMEELALQTARLRAVADLSSGVAHHFNNLLQIIMASTSLALLELETGSPSSIKSTLEKMLESTRLGAATVRRLQTFASIRGDITDGEATVFDLAVTNAASVSTPLWKSDPERMGINIDLHLDLEDGCYVNGQENEIFEVLVNLIRNAAEALPEGGNIEVRTYVRSSEVVAEVCDTGTGIAEEDMKRVFQPFWSTRGVGIGKGMGLAVTHGLVKRHGGTISVQSKQGSGTTFTIRLPLAENTIADAEQVMESDVETPLTILIIEDERHIAELLESILVKVGHRVFKALSGRDGLAIFDKEHIDLVLCDLGMPGMSGWDLGRAIRLMSQEKGIAKPPFILLTGWGRQRLEDQMISESGTDMVIAKPIDSAAVISRIREIAMGRASLTVLGKACIQNRGM